MACQNCNCFDVVLVDKSTVRERWVLDTYDRTGKSMGMNINFCPHCGEKPDSKVAQPQVDVIPMRTENVAELFHAFANIAKDVGGYFSGEKR